MTKWLALAIRTGRDGVADLDLAVGDDDAVDQQFEQGAPPIEVSACQALAHTAAERLGVRGQTGRLTLPLGVARELLLLTV